MKKVYVGQAAADIPRESLLRMEVIATRLDNLGFTVRCGNSLPSDKMMLHTHSKYEITTGARTKQAARDELARVLPSFGRMVLFKFNMHAKGVQMLTGTELDSPAAFFLTYKAKDQSSVNTIRKYAFIRNIRIFDLIDYKVEENLFKFIEENEWEDYP